MNAEYEQALARADANGMTPDCPGCLPLNHCREGLVDELKRLKAAGISVCALCEREIERG